MRRFADTTQYNTLSAHLSTAWHDVRILNVSFSRVHYQPPNIVGSVSILLWYFHQANSAFHPSGVDKWVVGRFVDVRLQVAPSGECLRGYKPGAANYSRLAPSCGSFLPVLNPVVVIPGLRAGTCAVPCGSLLIVSV